MDCVFFRFLRVVLEDDRSSKVQVCSCKATFTQRRSAQQWGRCAVVAYENSVMLVGAKVLLVHS
jgi:hypothetical protein